MNQLDLKYSNNKYSSDSNIIALKRNLLTCGADFFIDNYKEIKGYSLGNISRKETINIIQAKDKWSNITTVDKRLSTVKSIFINSENIDALKICIGKRIKDDYIQEAKYLLFKETGINLDIPIINKDTSFYWLNANKKIWDIDDLKIGEIQSYTTYNNKKNKRKKYQDMLSLKKGDLIVGYQGKPDSCIKGLFQVLEEVIPSEDIEKENFKFVKVASAKDRVNWNTLIDKTEILNTSLVQKSNSGVIPFTGSLQMITKTLYDDISNISKFDYQIKKNKNQNTSDMEYPLNQIFFGPPGTGKTYNISSETEKIINLKSSTNTLDRNKKFDIVIKNIRHKYNDEIYNTRNGNVIYRNFSKAINIWGYFLSSEYDTQNTLIHDELKNISGFIRSGWSQRMKYVTEFDFIDGNWYSDLSKHLGKDLELSDSGVLFKEKIREFIKKNNYTSDDLIKWDRDKGIPSIFPDQYCEVLKQVSPSLENMTAFKKSLICALNMCLNNELFRQNNESRNSTEEEIDLVRKYFDVNNLNSVDYKWIGWYAENLLDLGLVKQKGDEINNKFFYELTSRGMQLIDDIIDNWQTDMPSLFGERLNYEDSVNLGLVEFITFHQSYSYEEFIEGIRPNLTDSELSYSLEPGIFKRISERAKRDQSNNYVIIIDEINRGNISKIFGELITLIEKSKRLFSDNPKEHPKQVTLPYSKKLFGVPKNLYIMGTMNTADKSISLLDSALRRRFSFTEMLPNSSLIKQKISIKDIDIEELFKTVNSRIEFLIDKDHTIGHSYFLKIKDNQTIEALALIFKNEIIPLLNEYFYGDFEKIQLVLGDNKGRKSNNDIRFFNIKSSQQKILFGEEEAVDGYDEKIIFELNDDLFGLNKDGTIKGNSNQLVKLFKSVYSPKSN